MDLKQFLELFNPLPGNCYLQVTTKPDATTKALEALLKDADGELRVVLYDEDDALFRSPNYIDVLPQYDLVMAKKLHMWGNGL
ncbi:MAG: hypothetical protein FAF05_06995 [Epsilonproteobacteria bacterium]|nr:hypothetical protein [Campylobacterota bacterium]